MVLQMPKQKNKELEDKQNLAAFGLRVVELRKNHNPPLSQEDLAGLCELDRTYISGIENGRRNVGLANIFRLSKALGVTTEELFKSL